jgi:DNA repair exonuclease SbcCD ATPase subunit
MRVERIALKGITVFANAALDLRGLRPGLIAFYAENGEGKSTFMDAMIAAFLRMMPSRADADLAADIATERDSSIEADYVFDGLGLFRTRLNLDHVKKASDAVLVRIDANGFQHVLNDGKVSTFDKAVAQYFPPKDLMLASTFSAQDQNGNFMALSRKGKLDLFMRMLGLDRYEPMGQTAKTAAGFVEQTRGRLIVVRDRLVAETTDAIAGAFDTTRSACRSKAATRNRPSLTSTSASACWKAATRWSPTRRHRARRHSSVSVLSAAS